MTPSTFQHEDGGEGVMDLDAVFDVVNGFSGHRPGWTATIVFDPKSGCFVELRSSPPNIRGESEDEAQAVTTGYLASQFELSAKQIALIRKRPARWAFIDRPRYVRPAMPPETWPDCNEAGRTTDAIPPSDVNRPHHRRRSAISRLVRRCIIGFALVFVIQALLLQMSGRKVLISSGLERVYIFEGDLVSDIPPRNEQEAARTTEAVWRWCRYWTGLRVKHFPLPGREQCFIITP